MYVFANLVKFIRNLYICCIYWCYRVNLYEFADILISKGVVNAINLDGGGSATFLVDGVLTNHPSDVW